MHGPYILADGMSGMKGNRRNFRAAQLLGGALSGLLLFPFRARIKRGGLCL
jgi:hypothetical protein